MSDLQVNILSPAKIVAKTAARELQAPGLMGYMGILPGHAALVSELGIGELTVDTGSAKQVYFVAGGYVDVANDQVTVLVDVVEKPGDIDVKRAEAAKSRALDRLNDKAGMDMLRAQAALKRAEQRLVIAARGK